MKVSSPYGQDRVRSAVVHFLFGKSISSVVGILLLLVFVRYLTVEEFAAYSVFLAFVELFTALTGFGLTHALLRYVPELYAEKRGRELKGFIIWAVSIRLSLLTGSSITVYFLASYIVPWFGLGDWLTAFQLYLGVVLLRVNNHFLFQVLESTLHQSRAQFAFVISSWIKLIFVSILVVQHSVVLENIILVEIFSEIICTAILVFGVCQIFEEKEEEFSSGSFGDWWRNNASRVTRYGLAGYVQHLIILPYGSAPNRLLAGRFLETTSVAVFGFAQSFTDVIRRYLPAQLLAGLIRPVLIARVAQGRKFEDVSEVLAFVLRINTVILGIIAVPLYVAGQELLDHVTDGKYGADASYILLSLIGVLVLESRRFILDMVVQTVERYSLLVTANLLLACSLILSMGMLPIIGAIAIPISSAVSLILTNAWISHKLLKSGFKVFSGFTDLLKVLLAVFVASLVGSFVNNQYAWVAAVIVSLFVYSAALLSIGSICRADWVRVRNLMRRKL